MKGFFSLVLIGTTRLELIFYIVVADGFLLDLNNFNLLFLAVVDAIAIDDNRRKEMDQLAFFLCNLSWALPLLPEMQGRK